MLSEKLTLSLTFLVMVLAIGLVLTPAFAHKGTNDEEGTFEVSFTPGELMDDVSTTDHADVIDIQVESSRDRASAYPAEVPNSRIGPWYQVDGTTEVVDAAYAPPANTAVAGPILSFSIDFDVVVQLHDDTSDIVTPSGPALGLDDFTVEAYDDLFRSLGSINLSARTTTAGVIATGDTAVVPLARLKFKTPRVINVQDPGELPGRQFTLTIHNHALQNAYSMVTGGEFEVHYLLIQLAHGAADDASLATRQAALLDAEGDLKIKHSAGPKFIRVDLVEKDEGDPKYAKIASNGLTLAMDGDPAVVAITKVVDRSLVSAVETGPFDIRVMLTEEPKEFTTDQIRVKNGSAGNIRHLLPIPSPVRTVTAGAFPAANTEADADFAAISQEIGLNYHGTGIIMPPPAADGTPDTDGGDAGSAFPRATGRDNAYHLYAVTITPNADVNGFVTISLNDLEDKVLPISKRFDALTDAELVADRPQLTVMLRLREVVGQ